MSLIDVEILQKISVPNYQKVKTMVKRSIDQKLRLRNFDARNGRIESGAMVKSLKGIIGVEGGQRRGVNQRRSDVACQAIGLIRQSYAS